jgi:hypothetical protein
MTTATAERTTKAPTLMYHEVEQLREALRESDEVDALVTAADNGGAGAMSEEQFDKLCVRQKAAWALVRQLCYDVMDVTDYDPPICVDLGDAIIIVYCNQDNAAGNLHREIDAGWTASRRIARPEPTPQWAKKNAVS